MADETQRLTALVGACVNELGLDLENLNVRTSGKNRIVAIAVDADGGVGIDLIAQVSRRLSAALDADATMGEQPYTLEVSSRGTDQPLTLPRHWRRNRGRLVRVITDEGQTVEGRIGDSDDHGVDLVTKVSTTALRYQQIDTAVLTIELNPRRDI